MRCSVVRSHQETGNHPNQRRWWRSRRIIQIHGEVGLRSLHQTNFYLRFSSRVLSTFTSTIPEPVPSRRMETSRKSTTSRSRILYASRHRLHMAEVYSALIQPGPCAEEKNWIQSLNGLRWAGYALAQQRLLQKAMNPEAFSPLRLQSTKPCRGFGS